VALASFGAALQLTQLGKENSKSVTHPYRVWPLPTHRPCAARYSRTKSSSSCFAHRTSIMGERGMQIKSDQNNTGWEEAEFPIACETCLGDNPYVRMTKEPHGKACKICERPYCVFRWRPGTNARYKSTQVSSFSSRLT
jgi:hypothetical protein